MLTQRWAIYLVMTSDVWPFTAFRTSDAFHCFSSDFGEIYPPPITTPTTTTSSSSSSSSNIGAPSPVVPVYGTRWLGEDLYASSALASQTASQASKGTIQGFSPTTSTAYAGSTAYVEASCSLGGVRAYIDYVD